MAERLVTIFGLEGLDPPRCITPPRTWPGVVLGLPLAFFYILLVQPDIFIKCDPLKRLGPFESGKVYESQKYVNKGNFYSTKL
jgi:hypothetical protein